MTLQNTCKWHTHKYDMDMHNMFMQTLWDGFLFICLIVYVLVMLQSPLCALSVKCCLTPTRLHGYAGREGRRLPSNDSNKAKTKRADSIAANTDMLQHRCTHCCLICNCHGKSVYVYIYNPLQPRHWRCDHINRIVCFNWWRLKL